MFYKFVISTEQAEDLAAAAKEKSFESDIAVFS